MNNGFPNDSRPFEAMKDSEPFKDGGPDAAWLFVCLRLEDVHENILDSLYQGGSVGHARRLVSDATSRDVIVYVTDGNRAVIRTENLMIRRSVRADGTEESEEIEILNCQGQVAVGKHL
jgi:hypothetical protein